MKNNSALTTILVAIFALFSFFLPATAQANTFTDTFTASDGTDIHTYNSIYTAIGSPITIQNNSIPAPENVDISGHDFIDGCLSIDATGVTTNTGMHIRKSAAGFYTLIWWSNNWLLQVNDSTGGYAITSGTADFSGTHTYKLCAVGSTISAYRDGVELGSGTDTRVPGSGTQDFGSADVTIDNLSIQNLDNTQTGNTSFTSNNTIVTFSSVISSGNTSITTTQTAPDPLVGFFGLID